MVDISIQLTVKYGINGSFSDFFFCERSIPINGSDADNNNHGPIKFGISVKARLPITM